MLMDLQLPPVHAAPFLTAAEFDVARLGWLLQMRKRWGLDGLAGRAVFEARTKTRLEADMSSTSLGGQKETYNWK
jgi:hypothetical protein